MKTIRVRIAPSPTGPLHIGTARSALFNYLFARNRGGKFILRIEDTDLERSDSKFEKDIVEGLKWLGIEWDEGIAYAQNQKSKIKNQRYIGPYGPYKQSERIETYRKYIRKLLDEGKAYHCFCTLEELEQERKEMMERKEPPVYSGKCRNLSKKQVKRYQKEGRKSIIRFKVPDETIEFNDLIRGKLSFDTKLIGDISIARDVNTPLYNMAVVVDDYTMEISHIIRGEDHISNTPKQTLVQKALGFPQPEYAHLPLILGPDKSKLSKRHGATSINVYRQEGYLPEAMVNFMVLLGWNPKTEQEIFSKKKLIKKFDLAKIGKSGAIFNIERLDYINGFYIRQMKKDDFIDSCIPYLEKANFISPKNNRWVIFETEEEISNEYIKKAVLLEQERIKKLSEIAETTEFFFQKDLEYDKSLLIWKKMSEEQVVANLETAQKFLRELPSKEFKIKNLEKLVKKFIEEQGIGTGEFLWPLRAALCGRKASPNPFEIAEVLGKEKVLYRIEQAIEKF
jgi:glutamyl-tRNA synthetase